MRKIVCTAGTSLLTNAKKAKDTREQTQTVSDRRLIDSYLETCESKFKEDRERFFVTLSAETHSLYRLKVNGGDQVLLLHTETNDGEMCADALRQIIKDELKANCEIRKVEGLQIHDGERFRKVGLYNLFKVLEDECVKWKENAPNGKEVILNTTGGFKAVVPYITLFGLFHRIEVVYIFEGSKTLIRLPPLPFNFDYERLGQARPALQLLKKEGPLPREEFFKAIPGLPYDERPYYESLLEEDDQGYVTLSAFGFLFLDQWEKDTKEIYLSLKAREAYERSQGEVRERITRFLASLRDPLVRNNHKHSFEGTDLDVFKMPHQAERVAGFVQGDRLYVCCIYLSHDEYERDLPNYRRADFKSQSFEPWSPPEEYQSATEVPDEAEYLIKENQELKEKIARMEKDNMELLASYEKSENSRETALRERDEFRSQVDILRDTNEKLRQQSESLEAKLNRVEEEKREIQIQVEKLQKELAWAKRAWWRKLLGLPPANT